MRAILTHGQMICLRCRSRAKVTKSGSNSSNSTRSPRNAVIRRADFDHGDAPSQQLASEAGGYLPVFERDDLGERHEHLTRHKISCREPAVHATQHTLPTADTPSVNVRLARGQLHRLVRPFIVSAPRCVAADAARAARRSREWASRPNDVLAERSPPARRLSASEHRAAAEPRECRARSRRNAPRHRSSHELRSRTREDVPVHESRRVATACAAHDRQACSSRRCIRLQCRTIAVNAKTSRMHEA